MKYIGILLLSFVVLFAIGSFLAPFLAVIWAIATFSLTELIKGFLILYVCAIPVCMFMDAKKRIG